MTEPFTVLLVEDNPGDARLVEERFADARDGEQGLRVTAEDRVDVALVHAETLADGLTELDDADVVLLDLNLPDSTGIETLERVLDANERVPVVVLTGMPEDRLGIEAVSHGAQDFLSKDGLDPDRLVRTIRYAAERHRSEEALRQRTEQLALLNQLTRHDIRNDMTLVVGRARELDEHVDAQGSAALDEVVSASNHVLQLTRTVGDSVAAITGEDELALASVDLRPLLSDEIETARRLYRTATISVQAELPDVQVRANRLLSSVFGNLLSNAMLYNDAECPRVEVRAEASDERVTVEIADNGPGVPPYQHEEIFEKGVGDDSGGGSGIGLYIVDQLVDRYDGEVAVENRDTGAAFTVTLERI